MNVLSLFDGMSCARVALEKNSIKVDKYYASELDKYAIKVAQKNYPDTIQLGDVTKLDTSSLPRIDLLIGGSPCQGFSFAGKQLNFDDPRSKLFFEYVRILREVKPKYFILENVRMKKEYQDVISEALGVEPIFINSNLVSAQERKRLYWTNIKGIEQPKDRGIFLKDIIESGAVDRDKSFCIDANYFKGGNLKSYFEKHRRQIVFEQFGLESKALPRLLKNVRSINQKSFCLNATSYKGMAANGMTNLLGKSFFRKLTPIEAERLQTLPDKYTEGVSNTQRYKMLGNGFTVDVIAHILCYISEYDDLEDL